MSNEKYIRPEEACQILKCSNRSLQLWESSGKLQCVRTKGNHRRFLLSDIISKLPEDEQKKHDRRENICYCRVSSPSQKEDLTRQIEFFRINFPRHRIITDIGSGLNFKRKGLNEIINSAIKGNIKSIVVTHKDRLCRFGFELIERLISEYSNGEILVLNQEKSSPQSELATDLISIITVFSSRLYGLRSNSLKRQIKEATRTNDENTKISSISNEETDGKIEIDV